ncbi:MAG TPA: carbonic anhydrase [Micromonosporaceae bacterium]
MGDTETAAGTPERALAELLAGNERFVTGTRIHPHQDAERRAALTHVQRPFAVVFGCSDSRLAAEIIFDRGLGDLFVVRTAGHIVGPEVSASIEYGVCVLDAPLLVVLGHDSCGAIQAAYDAMTGAAQPSPGMRSIVERVGPSLDRVPGADLDEVMATHVRLTVDALSGSGIAGAVASGRCAVVGMTYHLAEGRVTVLAGETGP